MEDSQREENMIEYLSCTHCRYIYIKEELIHDSSNILCSICSSDDFSPWPGSEVLDLLAHVETLNPTDSHYKIIASVFISSAFEVLLDELLAITALYDRYYDEVNYLFDLLMDSYQGKNRKLQLFGHFADTSFEREAKETGNPKFFDHWGNVTYVRNNLVHGKKRLKKQLTKEQIETVIKEGLEVFSSLSNKYVRREHEYKRLYDYAIELKGRENPPIDLFLGKKPSKKDLKKLGKWRELILSSGVKLFEPPR